jgi:RNA polymerase-binding protein DksA
MARTTARKLAGKTAAAAKRVTSGVTGKSGGAATSKAAPARTTTAAATSSTAKKAPATSSTAKKAPAKKSAAKKAPAKKSSTTKSTATKRPAKKAPAAKAPAKKASGRTTQAKNAQKLAVKADEKPWTAAELGEVRGELNSERDRLRSELNLAEHELADLMRDAGDGAGNDQADVGSTTFERDHEMSLANNARLMLAQTEHALERIDDGSYGQCESCGQPIGKMRLMAFPRATLCLSCKQREERR